MISMMSGFMAVALGYQNALDFLIYFIFILLTTVALLVLDKRTKPKISKRQTLPKIQKQSINILSPFTYTWLKNVKHVKRK